MISLTYPREHLICNERAFRIRFFSDPRWRPPVIDEIMPDAERVINSIAKQFTDHTHYALQHEELMAEGRQKLAKLIDKGYHIRTKQQPMMTRSAFFKLFKASVNNHTKALVQKHRFTKKRNGNVPDRDDQMVVGQVYASRKNVDISLDDAENPVHVSDGAASDSFSGKEFMDELLSHLTPLEGLVLHQITEPNAQAILLAQIDSYRNPRKNAVLKFHVKDEHRAEGLGMDLKQYLEIQDSIRKKTMEIKDKTPDFEWNAAVQALGRVFNMQVPPNTDPSVVRRAFTVAARAEFSKVNDQVSSLLTKVGAKVPEKIPGSSALSCFGVLYDAHNQVCKGCQRNADCGVEAANYGLGTVSLSPKLVRQVRIPAVSKRRASGETVSDDPFFSSERDEEIYAYLRGHFDRVASKGEVMFRHRETSSGPVVVVDASGKFRIMKPSKTLSKELTRYKGVFFIPDDVDSDDAIKLISVHAKESLQQTEEVA